MRLEQIIQSLKGGYPEHALQIAENTIAFVKKECNGVDPSGDHGYLEELVGLFRAIREQRDSALHASAPEGYSCADCRMAKDACPECYAAWWKKRHPNFILPEAPPRVVYPSYPVNAVGTDHCQIDTGRKG